MDSAAQAIGEKRVRQYLVEPLLRRGLARPSSLTKADFEAMVTDLCSRLAYMSEANLAALEEQAAASPSGKEKDRFPIANKILEWASDIQRPEDDGSPLIRAVFAHDLGRDAIEEGWAPELLLDLRRNRRWPKMFAVKSIKDGAAGSIQKLRDFERILARGEDLDRERSAWRSRRLAALDKCRRIRGMSSQSERGT